MCVVSMVGDHYTKTIPQWPYWPQQPEPFDDIKIPTFPATLKPEITRAEFEALKREVEEMKELLKRAKEYDERNDEPDCEVDEKVALLKRVAELVGVRLDDVLGGTK